jgi:hypothetical protein
MSRDLIVTENITLDGVIDASKSMVRRYRHRPDALPRCPAGLMDTCDRS